ncbi:MAG TPA: class I SAM-dependent methyltransferase [Rhodospirillales bacterium]|jgi:2-polyprenyl-3-methyl-5-hydroxy-6-metoxy-1,4-benzoquinol methylase|nr:class I SAM-dependent methyltransferase [Rhodospirillales bacterium]|tara:strand:- start:629 stop:1330 length:702 start_codon:yes stop_codon:yes gene_type:complete
MSAKDKVDFYASYSRFKSYQTPRLDRKQARRFDSDFWEPANCRPDMAFLDVGCGVGLFLAYLRTKGVTDFLGIDNDPALTKYIAAEIAEKFVNADIWKFPDGGAGGRRFDRITLFDLLEHLPAKDGARLLMKLAKLLKPGGRVVVKVPNMGSPWGGGYQFGDLTHKAAYNPSSMRQLALASGYECITCYPHRQGSPGRRFKDRLLHGLLSRLVMTPPEIWSANFFAILKQRGD